MNISTEEFECIAKTQVELEVINDLVGKFKKLNDATRREKILVGAVENLVKAQYTLLNRLANCR